MKEFKKTDPEFNQIITDFVYDEAYHDCALDETEKYMCILAGLMGVQGKAMFKVTVEKALEDNIDLVIIKEVIYQASAYLGIGRTYEFLGIANEVFVEKNIALPLQPQGTTDKDTRLQAGAYGGVSELLRRKLLEPHRRYTGIGSTDFWNHSINHGLVSVPTKPFFSY